MLTAAFYEIVTLREGGLKTLSEAWHTFEWPRDSPKTLSKAQDRVQYSLALDEPVLLPAKAGFVLAFLGKPVLEWEFGERLGIPTLGPDDPPGAFNALPGEKWVQLNPAAADFVLQLRLRKVAPSGARDPGTGEQYVYGASRLVVSVALPRAVAAAEEAAAAAAAARPGAGLPETDMDRVLLI